MRKILLVSVVAGMALLFGVSTGKTDSKSTYESLTLFGDVFERIRSDYVEKVDDEKLIEAAINGMLNSLDPHSSYMNGDSYRNMQVQTRGQYGGLGMEVTLENGLVRVIAPIDDTPAERAGIKAGDYITGLDDEDVRGLTLNEAINRMRGTAGTDIKLTIARPGEDKPLEFRLTRAIIKVSPVRARAEDNVAYIRITSFSEQADKNLRQTMTRLRKKIGPDFAGVILDLRNNPGGLLDQAVAVSDSFLNHGEIVSTRGRHPRDIKRFNAHAGDIADGKPIIVLINGGSASASEIVAGALQDHRRALILGTRSFGKGSVQTVIPLGARGALRLTSARYYTPSGRSIQAKGIEPDIEVAQARVEKLVNRFPRRSEADLRGHLENPDAKKDNKNPGDESKAAPAGDGPSTADDADTPAKAEAPAKTDTPAKEEEDIKDYQLSYALDVLHGLSLISSRLQ